MPRRFKAKGLIRPKKVRKFRTKVTAVCYDGEKTEHDYFVGWRRILGSRGVTIAPIFVKSGGNALQAVEASIAKMHEDGEYDEVWCVCDVDDTSSNDLLEAQRVAAAGSVNLCLSRRCFEIWIALHWSPVSTSPIHTEKDAVSAVAKNYSNYAKDNKIVPFTMLLDKVDTALANADWLRKQTISNPMTDVDYLVGKLVQMLKKQK